MQTVVLAAGRGTRMRPLTERLPKPLLPVGDRPLLAHTLDAAARAGASEFVVVTGYRGERVRSRLGETHAGVPITYVEQAEPAGTADAVMAASAALDDAPFAVLNGDVLYDAPSLATLLGDGPAVASYRVENPGDYGVLLVENGSVTGVIEKPDEPPADLINAGAYVFPAEAREWLDVPRSDRGEFELTDVLERTCRAVDVRAVPLETWLDVGRPWELLAANEHVLGGIERSIAGTVDPAATVEGPVVVEAGASVRAGAVVEGPAMLRAGASVGPNAYVRPATLLGEDASVGHACEVKNSVIMAGSNVNHLSYVGDSVIGRGVNLGAGTIVANLRHDDEPVELTVKGERTSTGRRKFGVVIGDGAKTAIDTSLNAGVTLSVDARTTPGEVVLRDR